jgi:hypothetical protein
MTTAAENDGRCSNCRSTRQACDARGDSWPRHCCPACLQTAFWGTHVEPSSLRDGQRLAGGYRTALVRAQAG